MSSEQPGSWSCPTCTFLNTLNTKKCLTCEQVPKFWTCSYCNFDKNLEGTCLKCLLKRKNAIWNCSVCTAENDIENQNCSICSSKRKKVEEDKNNSNHWICSSCCYENTKDINKCDGCDASRLRQGTEHYNICEICSQENCSSNVCQTCQNKQDEVVWKCPTCSFQNSTEKSNCLACEEPKPLSIPKSKTWKCEVCPFPFNTESRTHCLFCQSERPSVCDECSRKIGDSYIPLAPNFKFHLSCFRCIACNKQIVEGSFVRNGEKDVYHPECYDALFSLKCRVCDNRIVQSYVREPLWGDPYCQTHKREDITVCCGCNRVWPDLKKNEMLKLGEDSFACNLCAQDCVLSTEEVNDITKPIFQFFSLLGLDISQRSIPIQVVDKIPSSKISAQQVGSHVLGRCETNLEHLYIGNRRISSSASVQRILIVKGLPRIAFEDVFCHELMHAYLALKGFPQLDSKVEEGLCQLLSFLWLSRDRTMDTSTVTISLHNGKVRELRLKALEVGTDEIYSEGFRVCYMAFLKQGCLAPLLDYVKQNKTIPTV